MGPRLGPRMEVSLFPSLVTDQSSDENQVNIPGIWRPSTLTQSEDEDIEKLLMILVLRRRTSSALLRIEMRYRII